MATENKHAARVVSAAHRVDRNQTREHMTEHDHDYHNELAEAHASGFSSLEDRRRYLRWLAVRNELAEQDSTLEELYDQFYVDLGQVLKFAKNERDWFARGAIEGAPLVMLLGPEKAGKSWKMGDLVVATTMGLQWLHQFQIERPGRVLYLDGEYGPPEFARRIARLARGRGIDPQRVTDKLDYHYSTDFVLEKNNPAYRRVAKDVRRNEYQLIILDPLRNHLEGSENESQVINDAFRALNAIRTAARCPVVTLHHLNKVGQFAGSRAITARNDLLLEGTDTDPPVYMAKGRTLRSHTDPIAQPFVVEVEHLNDDDEERAKTIVTWKPQGAFSSDPKNLKPLERKLLDCLRAQKAPRSLNYLASAVNSKSERIGEPLDRLEDLGLIEFCELSVEYRGKMYDGYKAKVVK